MAPRILIAMGADYSFEAKNIQIWVCPHFSSIINSSVATVTSEPSKKIRVKLSSIYLFGLNFILSKV